MIDILIVKDGNGEPIEWLFERKIDEEATQFLRAKELAAKAGVYIGERMDDFITDADEFETWLRLNDLLPEEEDDLTKIVRRSLELEAMYQEAGNKRREYQHQETTLWPAVARFREKGTRPLTGKIKVVDGKAYTRGSNGAVIELEQA